MKLFKRVGAVTDFAAQQRYVFDKEEKCSKAGVNGGFVCTIWGQKVQFGPGEDLQAIDMLSVCEVHWAHRPSTSSMWCRGTYNRGEP